MVTVHLICSHCTALLTAIHWSGIVAVISQLFSTKWDADKCKCSTLLNFPSFMHFYLLIPDYSHFGSLQFFLKATERERSKRSHQYYCLMKNQIHNSSMLGQLSVGFILHYLWNLVFFIYSLKYFTNKKHF